MFSSSNGRSLPLEWTIYLRDKRKRYEKSSYLWQYHIPYNFRVSCFVINKKQSVLSCIERTDCFMYDSRIVIHLYLYQHQRVNCDR